MTNRRKKGIAEIVGGVVLMISGVCVIIKNVK